MANLITEKQKKSIQQEYFMRLGSVFFFSFSLLGVFALIYMSLYYISISKNDVIVSDQLRSVIEVENKENVGKSATQIITQTMNQMRVVDLYSSNSLIPSEIFKDIISKKNSNIRINRLSFSLPQKEQGQFLVSGVAKNRDSLVSFIESLKSVDSFKSVESPISDFAKNQDIAFTVNIKTDI